MLMQKKRTVENAEVRLPVSEDSSEDSCGSNGGLASRRTLVLHIKHFAPPFQQFFN